MARITRKELKTDKFALEVEQGLTFFEEHQKEVLRYGGVVLGLVALYFLFSIYLRHQHTNREAALARAIQIQETSVGPAAPGAATTFPTQQVKDDVAIKAFTEINSKFSGSEEGEIAQYWIGSIRADEGNMSAAAKSFQEVAQKGDDRYASLAKLSLAQVYLAQGNLDSGRKVLEDLIAHPTMFVSKDQATIALARALIPTKPEEARKLLDPIRTRSDSVGEVARTLYGQLPAK
ncbi:MAG TPA: tetratricopeptide repeat protein [Bryobacteraceae bacterium]|nr:tetratricopeptide repeat protein [Bryobacteraceae bacterium]